MSSTLPATALLPARAAGIITRTCPSSDSACSCSHGLTWWGRALIAGVILRRRPTWLLHDPLARFRSSKLERLRGCPSRPDGMAQDAYAAAFAKQVSDGSELIMCVRPGSDNDTSPGGVRDVPSACLRRGVAGLGRQRVPENGAANSGGRVSEPRLPHTAPAARCSPVPPTLTTRAFDGSCELR